MKTNYRCNQPIVDAISNPFLYLYIQYTYVYYVWCSCSAINAEFLPKNFPFKRIHISRLFNSINVATLLFFLFAKSLQLLQDTLGMLHCNNLSTFVFFYCFDLFSNLFKLYFVAQFHKYFIVCCVFVCNSWIPLQGNA